MAKTSVTVRSCSVQSRELRFEQPPNFFVAELARAQPFDRRGDDRLTGAQRFRELPRSRRARDEGSRTVAQLDDSLVLELSIRFRHGVGVDDQPLGERPDSGQLLTL